MNKLRLNLDELRVEAFLTEEGSGTGGTVQGHSYTYTYGFPYACDHTVNRNCQTAFTGQPNCLGCQDSGNATCVVCPADTKTCEDCSYTGGGGELCYW